MTSHLEDQDVLFVQQDEVNERLDKLLALRFAKDFSRTYFQYLIEQGSVLLNGEIVKKRTKLKNGDEIQVYFSALPEIDLQPQAIPLEILYEDEDLLAVNKPAGLVVHPAPGHYQDTFVNALLYHCQSLKEWADGLRPGIVHRLDKDTSGVLIAAKNLPTQQKLIELFASRSIYKEYIAICWGKIGSGHIEKPIGRHPIHRKMMAVVQTGKPALTYYETIGSKGEASLIKVIIATGRTHQIRVHMKEAGAPLLGDPTYGSERLNKKWNLARQMLHARCIKFIHPFTKKELMIEAPLPQDMQALWQKLS